MKHPNCLWTDISSTMVKLDYAFPDVSFTKLRLILHVRPSEGFLSIF